MVNKPGYKDQYVPEVLDLIRSTCLYMATMLGDLRDDLVVVGGLVPSLLSHDMSAESKKSDLAKHAGGYVAREAFVTEATLAG